MKIKNLKLKFQKAKSIPTIFMSTIQSQLETLKYKTLTQQFIYYLIQKSRKQRRVKQSHCKVQMKKMKDTERFQLSECAILKS